MEVNSASDLLGYKHSSKYPPLYSAEQRNSFLFVFFLKRRNDITHFRK